MNSPTPSTATSEIKAICAAQAALPPWQTEPVLAKCWVPVMADGEPCLANCVRRTVGAFATKAEAEAAAYSCTMYGGPNKVVQMTLVAEVERHCKTPGFVGYYDPNIR